MNPLSLFESTNDLVCISGAKGGVRPVVDRYFAFGAISSLVGSIYLGFYLWLIRSGFIGVTPNYPALSQSHFNIQLILYFGFFILGFVLQAVPKMLGLSYQPARQALLSIPLALLGIGSEIAGLGDYFFRGALFLAYALPCQALLRLIAKSSPERQQMLGPWVAISLLSFSIAPLFNPTSPAGHLVAILCAVCSLTLAAGRQFIAGFLGGAKVSLKANYLQLVFYLLTLITATLATVFEMELWSYSGLSLLATIVVYINSTKLLQIQREMLLNNPLAVAFSAGVFWAVLASLNLFIYGAAALDVATHMIALGWVVPLILAISAQMLRAITGQFILSATAMRNILFFWQAVPICRTVVFYQSSSGMVMLTGLVASVVIGAWSVAVINSTIRYRPV